MGLIAGRWNPIMEPGFTSPARFWEGTRGAEPAMERGLEFPDRAAYNAARPWNSGPRL